VNLKLQDFEKTSPIKNYTKRRKEPVENSSIISSNANSYSVLQVLNGPGKEEFLEESEGNAFTIKGIKKNFNDNNITNSNNVTKENK
jgi:hypothetical protein